MNELNFLLKITFIVSLLVVLGNFNAALAEEYVEPQIDLNIALAREETRANTQYILGNVLKKSAALQEEYGDFAPFGVGLFKDGSIKYVWYAKPGETVKKPAQSIPLIRRALQAQAVSEKIVGSAVVYKYQKELKQALQLNVELEYQTGLALAYASEMRIDANNKVEWGESSQVNFEPRVFVMPEDDSLLPSKPSVKEVKP